MQVFFSDNNNLFVDGILIRLRACLYKEADVMVDDNAYRLAEDWTDIRLLQTRKRALLRGTAEVRDGLRVSVRAVNTFKERLEA